jgi:hypothetical protein
MKFGFKQSNAFSQQSTITGDLPCNTAYSISQQATKVYTYQCTPAARLSHPPKITFTI